MRNDTIQFADANSQVGKLFRRTLEFTGQTIEFVMHLSQLTSLSLVSDRASVFQRTSGDLYQQLQPLVGSFVQARVQVVAWNWLMLQD